MSDRILQKTSEALVSPEFLRKDGIYEISDADLAQYFQKTVPPVVLSYSIEGSGGDFRVRLNGELVSRTTVRPSWYDSDFRWANALRDTRGQKSRRIIRYKDSYLLGEKERDLEPDNAGRPSDSLRFTQLERIIPASERGLSEITTRVLWQFFGRYLQQQPAGRAIDADGVRNEFFIHDSGRRVSAKDIEKIQENANVAEGELNAYRDDLGGEELTTGLFEVRRMGERQSWLHVRMNGGAVHDDTFGRLYINIPPEKLHAFFTDFVREVLPEALKNDAGIDVKTIVRCTAIEIERVDNFVVYFNDRDITAITEALYRLAGTYPELRRQCVQMPLTARVKIHDDVFHAVTFAQQPTDGGSWAEHRARLLVLTKEILEKKTVANPKASSQEAFFEACAAMNIDPSLPAFEADGEKHFVQTAKQLVRY